MPPFFVTRKPTPTPTPAPVAAPPYSGPWNSVHGHGSMPELFLASERGRGVLITTSPLDDPFAFSGETVARALSGRTASAMRATASMTLIAHGGTLFVTLHRGGQTLEGAFSMSEFEAALMGVRARAR